MTEYKTAYYIFGYLDFENLIQNRITTKRELQNIYDNKNMERMTELTDDIFHVQQTFINLDNADFYIITDDVKPDMRVYLIYHEFFYTSEIDAREFLNIVRWDKLEKFLIKDIAYESKIIPFTKSMKEETK